MTNESHHLFNKESSLYIFYCNLFYCVKVIFLNCVGNVFCKFDNRKMKCFYDKL